MPNGIPVQSKAVDLRARIGLITGPVAAAVILLFFDLDPGHPEITGTFAVALLMAVWWITEAVPLAVTSLLPVVLFPALGIMNGKKTAPLYFNHIIFLFIGGFLVALAIERWSLHKRIALRVLMLFGGRPAGILLGFMAATAVLSMWISNTATTMMMVPIATAVIFTLEKMSGETAIRRYATGLLIAIAYSATIGGIATLVGTPPNMAFARIWSITFPDAPEIGFVQWMIFALPIALIFLVIVWIFLSIVFIRGARNIKLDDAVFQSQYDALGPMSFEEKVVLIDFIAMALLWLTRADLKLGFMTIPGWSHLFGEPAFLNDGTVAVAMAVILFIMPSGRSRSGRIMDWQTATRLPWDIVLLFGGGFALAGGFKQSGLSAWMGHQLSGLSAFNPVWIVAAICLMTTFLTELTSNTATAQILLPILGALAVTIRVHPLLLMIPGTLSCSFAFMLPVATPPNAIVFGSGRLRIPDMAQTGLLLNLVGVPLVTAAVYLLGRWVFHIDLSHFPGWAVLK